MKKFVRFCSVVFAAKRAMFVLYLLANFTGILSYQECVERWEKNGFRVCCNPKPCPAGTQPVCSQGVTEVDCEACPGSGFFSLGSNWPTVINSCTPHTQCVDGLVVDKPGNTTSDTTCKCAANYTLRKSSLVSSPLKSTDCEPAQQKSVTEEVTLSYTAPDKAPTKSHTVIIVFSVIGFLGLLVITGALVWCLCHKRRKHSTRDVESQKKQQKTTSRPRILKLSSCFYVRVKTSPDGNSNLCDMPNGSPSSCGVG